MGADAILSTSTVTASEEGPSAPATPTSTPSPSPEAPVAPVVEVQAVPAAPVVEAQAIPESQPHPAPVEDSWEVAAKMVGRWQKVPSQCADEGPLMEVMEMNWVFRQAAALLNEVQIDRDASGSSWTIASAASIISLAETYPVSGAKVPQSRRDMHGGQALGSIEAVPGGVRLTLTWTGELPGTQVEEFNLDGDQLNRFVELKLDNGRGWSGGYVYRRA